MTDRQSRWDEVYRSKGADTVSWYQARPTMSLALIAHAGVVKDVPLIDVGGGASVLVDHLLREGYTELSVLDLSASVAPDTWMVDPDTDLLESFCENEKDRAHLK